MVVVVLADGEISFLMLHNAAAGQVEQVLLAVGKKMGHENISYAERMNKVVVIFMKEEGFVSQLIENGVYLNLMGFYKFHPSTCPESLCLFPMTC